MRELIELVGKYHNRAVRIENSLWANGKPARAEYYREAADSVDRLIVLGNCRKAPGL